MLLITRNTPWSPSEHPFGHGPITWTFCSNMELISPLPVLMTRINHSSTPTAVARPRHMMRRRRNWYFFLRAARVSCGTSLGMLLIANFLGVPMSILCSSCLVVDYGNREVIDRPHFVRSWSQWFSVISWLDMVGYIPIVTIIMWRSSSPPLTPALCWRLTSWVLQTATTSLGISSIPLPSAEACSSKMNEHNRPSPT